MRQVIVAFNLCASIHATASHCKENVGGSGSYGGGWGGMKKDFQDE